MSGNEVEIVYYAVPFIENKVAMDYNTLWKYKDIIIEFNQKHPMPKSKYFESFTDFLDHIAYETTPPKLDCNIVTIHMDESIWWIIWFTDLLKFIASKVKQKYR